jgi:AcrR family transcriptional regulator
MSTNGPVDGTASALKPGRGRRPADDVRRAALAAAGELLLAEGIGGVTFAKIAARAGISRMTLYKWWPSPGSLAYEAYSDVMEAALAFPDTGDVRRDIGTQLHAFAEHLRRHGRLVAELVGAAQSDPDLAEALSTRYVQHRRKLAVERLTRAQRQGQIRADADLEAVVDQLWGACYHRLLLPAEPLTDAFVDGLLDNLFTGIEGRPGRVQAP